MANISRRGFLAGMLSIAAVAVTGTAAADVSKFHEVVRMHDEILTLWAGGREPKVHDAVTAGVDQLLNYMLDNFAAPTAEDHAENSPVMLEMGRVLDRDCYNEGVAYAQRFRDVPPTLIETVIPVAVMRSLLMQNKIRFNPSKMISWQRFAHTYMDLILASK